MIFYNLFTITIKIQYSIKIFSNQNRNLSTNKNEKNMENGQMYFNCHLIIFFKKKSFKTTFSAFDLDIIDDIMLFFYNFITHKL